MLNREGAGYYHSFQINTSILSVVAVTSSVMIRGPCPDRAVNAISLLFHIAFTTR